MTVVAKGQIDNVTAESITTSFNQGMAAFEEQKWAKAVASLEKAISLIENYPDKEAAAAKPRLVGAYYMVGAAHFNVPDFPKAIAAFGRIITMVPKDEKVPHARLSVARATFLNGDFGKAAKLFAELEQYPSLREQALIIQSQCLKESGKIKELVVVVVKLIADGITTSGRANAALMLAQARANAGEFDKLAPLLDQLVTRRNLVENVVELNALIVALGDAQMAQDQFEKASRTYLKVLPPAQVIEFQKQRIEMLTRRIAANKAAAKNSPQATLNLMGPTAELQSVLDQAKELLADFEKLTDYMPGLMLRNARCWYGRDKKWESILMNERLLELYPDAAQQREAALFGNVICYADLMQVKSCQRLCEQYFKEFPKGENVQTVAYVQGAVAIQDGDMKGAATIFNQMVDAYPESPYINQMYLLLGSARMGLGELNEAARVYQRYIDKHPKGSAVEEAEYRLAVIPVYRGRYEEAWKLLEAFLKNIPPVLSWKTRNTGSWSVNMQPVNMTRCWPKWRDGNVVTPAEWNRKYQMWGRGMSAMPPIISSKPPPLISRRMQTSTPTTMNPKPCCSAVQASGNATTRCSAISCSKTSKAMARGACPRATPT